MKQQGAPEQLEWFRQQAMDFARRAAAAPDPLLIRTEDVHASTETEYQEFLKSHPANGSLKVQVYTARGALPVEKAAVEIAKRFSGKVRILYQGVTDSAGIMEDVALPALPASYSQSPNTAAQSGTDYQVSVFHPSFQEETAMKVTIFDRIQTILPVSLQPQQK